MDDFILKKLAARTEPIDVVVVGLGFMGFGFVSAIRQIPGMRVPLILTRRPEAARDYLLHKGFPAVILDKPAAIQAAASKGKIAVSDNLDLIAAYDNQVVLEMTGTVDYGAEVGIRALQAGKHLITMNPELQATVGTLLKRLADKHRVITTDVIGDQPGSLIRLMNHARMLGFNVLMAGNMKRYLDRHATQEKMQPWADDKGLAVRQTVSFTDGTKQAIEMTLVGNHQDMTILQPSMVGPEAEHPNDALTVFDWRVTPTHGIVDYIIGKNLFPGIFIVAEHPDPHQQGYLRYLGLGEGPRYVLFEPYHLCHLEVPGTIAKVVLLGQGTIDNGLKPHLQTVAYAKRPLKKGEVLDGIGGDLTYGNITTIKDSPDYLPMGLSHGAVLKRNLNQDQPIRLNDVKLSDNAATRLLNLV